MMLLLTAGPGATDRLAAALGAVDVASVVIAPSKGKVLDAAAVTPLVAATQKAGAAALIQGDAKLAREVNADGVHLSVSDTAVAAYGEARELLGQQFVVGIDAGRSRHDAMSLAETGADYIGFGIPAFVKDREASSARRLELIRWWAEIFEVPCVAFDVASVDDARALAAAGADFVAFDVAGDGQSPGDCAARAKVFAAAIADGSSHV